jgi:hypothetical protein
MIPGLHVTNGDATDVIGTGLAERVLVWFDVLHEGPVPDVPPDELRRIRAGFLGDPQALRRFEERDATLEAARDGRYMLWFEADLYDQLQLAQILSRLAALSVPAERITLICIGEYPGIAHFGGLGELTASQLRELPATGACAPLRPAALDLAGRAWAALTAPEPGGLGDIAAARSIELRFLASAFDRLSREYPSTRDGLSLTERRLLAAVASGAETAGQAFVRGAAREARAFLGDTWAFAAMERLARAREPLLDADLPIDRNTSVKLTAAGADILAGAADHVALNGIDRWIGGVHLTGPEARWRWDEGTEAIRPGSRPA